MELIKLKLLDTDGMTLLTAPAAGQEVPSCCTDNLTVASPVVLRQLAPVPQRKP